MPFLRSRARQVAAYFSPPPGGAEVRMTPETHPDQYVNPDGIGEREAQERRRAEEAAWRSSRTRRRSRFVLGVGFLLIGIAMLTSGSGGVPFVVVGLLNLGEVAWSVSRDRRGRRDPRESASARP